LTGMALNLAEVAQSLGSVVETGWEGIDVTGVTTDSRKVEPGEIFFALIGEHFDGHDFIDIAAQKGAAAAIVSRSEIISPGIPLVRVPDTLIGLGDLASFMRNRPGRQRIKVVALTGSNGKTTTKEMLAAILSGQYSILSTRGNFNNLVGLPLTLFDIRPEHEIAVLEMGMNRPGEIARLTEIASPDIGLITNIGPAHLEGLGSIEGVARAKGELFRGLPDGATAVINLDDSLVTGEADAFQGSRLTFGFSRQADIHPAGSIELSFKGTRFTLITPDGTAAVRFKVLGRHNVSNALAASAAASALGFKAGEIAAGLNDFTPFPGRLELMPLSGSVHLINDTYNANPASAQAALAVLRGLRRKRGRVIAVLGDMLELGTSSLFEHDLLGRAAAAMKIDLLAAVGLESKATSTAAEKAGLPKSKVFWFPETGLVADWLCRVIRPHDLVLIKGSRGMRMERIVDRMRKEGGA
jgi:UDP-N-acetylmuramoyl-tripeptide--D-alanyl-D-alanine ligase